MINSLSGPLQFDFINFSQKPLKSCQKSRTISLAKSLYIVDKDFTVLQELFCSRLRVGANFSRTSNNAPQAKLTLFVSREHVDIAVNPLPFPPTTRALNASSTLSGIG